MRKSWQIKTLLFFLVLFILSNIEAFIINTIEFIVRIPLNFNSFMINVVGTENWSKIIVFTSNPALLIFATIFLCIIAIGIIRSFESLKK